MRVPNVANVSTPHSGYSNGDAVEDATLNWAEITRLGKIDVDSEQVMLIQHNQAAEVHGFLWHRKLR